MTLRKILKQGIRVILRNAGIEIAGAQRMKRLMNPAGSRRGHMLRYHDIQTVIDVGANAGQYGVELREWGFRGRIISFEPTNAAFKTLSERAAADPCWSTFNFAVGAEDGVAEINVASNSGISSSLLPMLETHRQVEPETRYVAAELIAVKTLDSALADVIASDEILMLKMDVQGFEHFVLRGAARILSQVRLIECELSFESLYEGQLLFPEMLALLETLGFQPVNLNSHFPHPATGHCLHVDGVFTRAQEIQSTKGSCDTA
jgi:FkbM family methyltransferase